MPSWKCCQHRAHMPSIYSDMSTYNPWQKIWGQAWSFLVTPIPSCNVETCLMRFKPENKTSQPTLYRGKGVQSPICPKDIVKDCRWMAAVAAGLPPCKSNEIERKGTWHCNQLKQIKCGEEEGRYIFLPTSLIYVSWIQTQNCKLPIQ